MLHFVMRNKILCENKAIFVNVTIGKYSTTHLLIYKSILVERIRERGKNIKKQIQIKFFTAL